ncbi:MAG: hypothetical protein HS111_33765 [Kofleriaceae bacterium]|nr:hypothetical protein [Kofleriaceae bacterium]MCL4225999.1 hypothetical protein [Myxococcales bacterium]
MRKLSIIIPTLCLVALAVALVVRPGTTQPAPGKLVIGIYAPSVEFGTAQDRLSYVQGLAKAIEAQTGVKTEAKSFASFGALKSAGVDFAIVDAQCYATNLGWNLLANAQIGGSGARTYALFSGAGGDMKALEGKKLAFVQTGCNDNGFVDNAMLESEVDAGFFASRVGKPDLTAAVAEVASYKGAQAVFAPIGSQKGLAKLFDTGAVPNPAFVQVNAKVPAATVASVGTAVTRFGGGGAISGWASPSKAAYQGLAGRMGRVVKRGVFASPEPVRFDVKDVLIEPASLDEAARTEVRQHFEKSPERME